MPEPKRYRNENIRRLVGKQSTFHVTLPREVSDILRAANVSAVRITVTDEGVLLTPYRGEQEELPKWAKGDE